MKIKQIQSFKMNETTPYYVSALDVEEWATKCINLERERDEAIEESLEQARLLGISGERECRLIAERDEAKAIAKEAITGLYTLGDYDLANRLSSKLEETK